MIEENKHIDHLFQEKLGDRTFEVPASFLKDLEKRIDTPKVSSKRITSFWFWLSALAVTGLCATSLLFLQANDISLPVASVAKSTTLYSNSAKEQTSSIFIPVQNSSNTETTNIEINASPNKPNKEEKFVPLDQYRKTPKAYTAKKQDQLAKLKEQALAESVRIKDSVERAEKIAMQNAMNSNANNSMNSGSFGNLGENGMSTSAANSATNPNLPLNSAALKLLSDNKRFGESNGVVNQFTLGDKQLNYVDDTLKKIRYIIRDSVVFRDSIVIKDSIRFAETNPNNPDDAANENKKSRFELQGFVGFMMVRPTIQSPFQSYADQLKAGETSIISPDFGFALNTYFQKWSIGAGLNYYQFGEKTKYNTQKVTLTSQQFDTTVITVYFDSTGAIWDTTSPLPIFDSVTTTQIDTTSTYDTTSASNSWINSYSRVVIPINFGYQFTYKNWAFTPRVGLNFEFATNRQKGLYADAKLEEILEVDQRKFGLSYQLQLEIRRNFGPWHVFVNPYYRNNMGQLINTTNLQRKYGGFGTTFGVGIRF